MNFKQYTILYIKSFHPLGSEHLAPWPFVFLHLLFNLIQFNVDIFVMSFLLSDIFLLLLLFYL